MKKILSIGLAIIMILLYAPNVAAINNHCTRKEAVNSVTVNAFCEEYPEAYIEMNNEKSQRSTQVNEGKTVSITASVYVEEKYEAVDGKQICVSSRLLSEDEVYAIGKDKFVNLSSKPIINSPSDSTSRGKLTVTFQFTPLVSTEYEQQYTMIGTAKWSGFVSHVKPYDTPSAGEDFAGFMWGGGYDFAKPKSSAVDNFGANRPVYDADAGANGVYVWSAQEGALDREEDDYLESWRSDLLLRKKVLTGNGNTTSVTYKYIHTYTATAGSLNFSVESGGVSSSFSLGGVDKQWSIVIANSEIPY